MESVELANVVSDTDDPRGNDTIYTSQDLRGNRYYAHADLTSKESSVEFALVIRMHYAQPGPRQDEDNNIKFTDFNPSEDTLYLRIIEYALWNDDELTVDQVTIILNQNSGISQTYTANSSVKLV